MSLLRITSRYRFSIHFNRRCTQQRSYLHVNSSKYPIYNQYLIKRGLSSSNQAQVSKKKPWFGIEWFYIPAGVGFGLISFLQLKRIVKRNKDPENEHNVPSTLVSLDQWQIDLLKQLPTRSFSRVWGYICDTHLPLWLRKPIINTYSRLFNCNMEEALVPDIEKYESLNKFFTRKLKRGVRPINNQATVVSPADCTVLSLGSVSTSSLELDQIKGISYPLDVFTGPRHPFLKKIHQYFEDDIPLSCPSQNNDDDFQLYYCSLYLGPGDYHRFHSPAEWTVEHRRHIPGDLFSVNPWLLRKIRGIFNFNERVLLYGRWEWGVFLYGAIGAYNVGSIKLDFKNEKDLRTNTNVVTDGFKDRLYGSGILMKRGESVGRFELGSSIVLVFTAPKDFQFNISPGQKLKYGESLGKIDSDVT